MRLKKKLGSYFFLTKQRKIPKKKQVSLTKINWLCTPEAWIKNNALRRNLFLLESLRQIVGVATRISLASHVSLRKKLNWVKKKQQQNAGNILSSLCYPPFLLSAIVGFAIHFLSSQYNIGFIFFPFALSYCVQKRQIEHLVRRCIYCFCLYSVGK